MKIDYTTKRKGSKTDHGRIEICKKCGRKGAHRVHHYKMGAVDAYTHMAIFREGPFPHWSIQDHCEVRR